VPELRRKYMDVCGEVTRSRHKPHLIRRIVWQLQARAEGDLSDRARKRAAELAAGVDLRLTAPKVLPAASGQPTVAAVVEFSQDSRLPPPGTILTRIYLGETLEVRVLAEGFEYGGEIYRSLSAVAKTATGKHWNGYHFFQLGTKGKRSAENRA
jgi:hypothetical protein